MQSLVVNTYKLVRKVTALTSIVEQNTESGIENSIQDIREEAISSTTSTKVKHLAESIVQTDTSYVIYTKCGVWMKYDEYFNALTIFPTMYFCKRCINLTYLEYEPQKLK